MILMGIGCVLETIPLDCTNVKLRATPASIKQTGEC